jgi:hypothetical protein
MRIGSVLRDARERAGLELRDLEATTKIRLRYLAALEDEHWDDLPSPAYAKGFLRTYAQLLGLDGEALVDEFRRQVESGPGESSYPLGDQVLSRRARKGGRTGPPAAVVALAVVALVVLALVAIGLVTGGDDEAPSGGAPAEREDRDGSGERGNQPRAEGTVVLALRVREPVEVCLVGGGGDALIDRQVLAAGTEDEFERRRFELRFPDGFEPRQIEVEIAGEPRRLPRVRGEAAYEIVAPKRVEAVEPPAKEDCP